jgi:hypothetical protein
VHNASGDGNKMYPLLLSLHDDKIPDKVKENVPGLKIENSYPVYTKYSLTQVVISLAFIHNLYTSS